MEGIECPYTPVAVLYHVQVLAIAISRITVDAFMPVSDFVASTSSRLSFGPQYASRSVRVMSCHSIKVHTVILATNDHCGLHTQGTLEMRGPQERLKKKRVIPRVHTVNQLNELVRI